MKTWKSIFTDPEDPNWHITTDSLGTYGLNHNCQTKIPENYHDNTGCMYCGEKPTDCMKGMFNLISWGEEV